MKRLLVSLLALAVLGSDAAAEDSSEQASRPTLRITAARYGGCGAWVDVVDRLEALVKDGRLSVRASNSLAGDPAPGIPKALWVEYELAGHKHTAQVREGERLYIPPRPVPAGEPHAVATVQQLCDLAEACPAEVGFFGKNLTTGRTVEYRPDQPACLASIVKIFVLLEVARQCEEGTLDPSAFVELPCRDKTVVCPVSVAVDRMIGESDNDATDALAGLVGYDQVNALPKELGIAGLSPRLVPEPGAVGKVLDRRLSGTRLAEPSELLPLHGTARAIVQFFELLHERRLISPDVSLRVLEVLDGNPKPFAPGATPVEFVSVGKGGSILWKRLFWPQYNMIGWGLYVRGPGTALAFCLWCEWFPAKMDDAEREKWCRALSDSVVTVLLSPEDKVGSSQAIPKPGDSPDARNLEPRWD